MNESKLKRIIRMIEKALERAVRNYEWHKWQREARWAMRNYMPCVAEMAMKMAERCRPDGGGEHDD